MALFRDMVCYQEEVRDPSRIAEVAQPRDHEGAARLSAPAQINVPRDFWTQVIDVALPHDRSRSSARPAARSAVAEAAKLLSEATFPVILSGAGVVLGDAIRRLRRARRALDAPVCSGYQHNDSFPGSHPLAVGPLGYNGSKAAMELIARADVVLALGTRLNPFSTLPGYGIDYWPQQREDHPGRHQPRPHRPDQDGRRSASAATPSRSARADSRAVAPKAGDDGPRRTQGADPHDQVGLAAAALRHGPRGRRSRHDLERARARTRTRSRMSPRQAWRAIQAGLPRDAIISSDIGNNCAIGNAYPTFETGPQISRARAVRPVRLRLSRRSSARRSAIPTRRSSALPATAPSASR